MIWLRYMYSKSHQRSNSNKKANVTHLFNSFWLQLKTFICNKSYLFTIYFFCSGLQQQYIIFYCRCLFFQNNQWLTIYRTSQLTFEPSFILYVYPGISFIFSLNKYFRITAHGNIYIKHAIRQMVNTSCLIGQMYTILYIHMYIIS